MKYKIFKMAEPSVLDYPDHSGYQISIRSRIALEAWIWTWETSNSFETEQEARDYVASHEEEFRSGNHAIILTF